MQVQDKAVNVVENDKKNQINFIDIWKAFPLIGAFLTQKQKIIFHSLSSAIRQLTCESAFWPCMQITSQAQAVEQQILWIFKRIKKFKPAKLAISLFEVNENFIISTLTNEVAITSVQILDIYCQSIDLHLACSLYFPNAKQLTLRSKCVNNELVQFMASNLQKLNSLVIIKNDMEFTCKKLSKYMKNPMQKLVVKPYVIDFQQIQQITEKSQNSLKQLEIDVEQCDQKKIINILKPLNKLQRLRLYHLENLQQDKQLAEVLEKQTKIQQLALTKAYNFQLNRILHVVSSKYLLVLDITDSKFVSNGDIKRVGEVCSNLKQVNLSWCNSLTSEGIAFLIQKCLNIQILNLTGIKQLKDVIFGQGYINLLNYFDEEKFNKFKNKAIDHPQIRQNREIYQPQYFFNFKQTARPSQLKNLRKLRNLNCESCNGISDNILKVIYLVNLRARTYNYYGNYMGLFPNDNQSTFC